MVRNNRLSLGGNEILQDSTSQFTNASSSTTQRRMSFSFTNSDPDKEAAKKGRRAMLEEWRKGKNRNNPSTSSSNHPPTPSGSMSLMSIANSSDTSNNTENTPSSSSLTALERYRLRKQQQNDENKNCNNTLASVPPSLPPVVPPSTNSIPRPPSLSSMTAPSPFESAINVPSPAREKVKSRILNLTPRRLSSSSHVSKKARRRTFSADPITRSRPLLPPTDSMDCDEKQISNQSEQNNEDITTSQNVGLHSRIEAMQIRINQLEKDKLELTKSKAPLEARIRQREDAWMREKSKILEENEKLKAAGKEADERYRELELENSALQDERSKLKYEALKAGTNCGHSNANANAYAPTDQTWNNEVQYDRDIAELKEKIKEAGEEIQSLKLEKVSLESDLYETSRERNKWAESYNQMKADYDMLESCQSNNSEAAIQLEVLTTEHTATTAQLHAACNDLAATKSSLKVEREEKEREWNEEKKHLLFKINVLKAKSVTLETLDNENNENSDDIIPFLKARNEELLSAKQELETQLINAEQHRRVMHNRIQELRGNIRVFVRTRPFLPGDGSNQQSSIEVGPDGESLTIRDAKQGQISFNFDKVFPQSGGQDSVFEEVSDFVQSSLDGYHVCLFSYGQTGSGKTHTMQGSGNGVMRGIIPRAVEQILNQAKKLQTQRWRFQVSVSFLEIYNEELRDLLTEAKEAGGRRPNKKQKLLIRRSDKGKGYVDGLSKVKINTEDGYKDLEKLMTVAARARSVASTKMNNQSSRSHSIFMLHLTGVNDENGTAIEGSLNLCDLAGSERLDRSGVSSDPKRLKETQAINKSLMCLGEVFNSLANRSSHIPYRNSKLTYLLQDCLSGDGKALMFVNLSPTLESSNETLCSLRFAKRVNQVELGKATKNVKYVGK